MSSRRPAPISAIETTSSPGPAPRAMRRELSLADPTLAKPGDDFLSILVRREYRIEQFSDDAVVDDECHAFEQRHAGNLERRQLEGARKLEPFVGKHRKRQVQTLHRFALIGAVLRRQTKHTRDPEPLEFGKMVAKAARL